MASVRSRDQLALRAEAWTRALVAHPSVTGSPGEALLGGRLVRLLRGEAVRGFPCFEPRGALRVHVRAAQPGRAPTILAELPGGSADRVLLMGHYDTVGTEDYPEMLRPFAHRPEALARRMRTPQGWMPGRGTLDMKSGLGAGIAALEYLAAEPASERPGDVTLLLTPDEEQLSRGMLAAHRWPALLRHPWALALSLDFVAPPAAGKLGVMYRGTIGKCLIQADMYGHTGHAAQAAGLLSSISWGAEWIRSLEREWPARLGPAPVVLRAEAGKDRYDTQLPPRFRVSLSLVGEKLPLKALLAHLSLSLRRSAHALGHPGVKIWVHSRGAARRAKMAQGEAWDVAAEALPEAELPARPGARLYLVPPFYAARSAARAPSGAELRTLKLLRAFGVEQRGAYPYISDLSLLGSERTPVWSAARAACPVDLPPPGVGISVPQLTLGPWGREPHAPGEAVQSRYAFEALPWLVVAAVRAAQGEIPADA